MDLPIVSPTSWLHGWNFTTELYRILEHAMDDFHRRCPRKLGPFTPSELFRRDAPSQSVILEKVMSMYNGLPPKLKRTNAFVSEMTEDIFGFQAANITATLQVCSDTLIIIMLVNFYAACANGSVHGRGRHCGPKMHNCARTPRRLFPSPRPLPARHFFTPRTSTPCPYAEQH